MRYHKGNWRGEKTEYLEKISIAYADRFGYWPDGYEDFCVNLLSYRLYVNLIELCLQDDKSIEDVLPPKEYPDLWIMD